MNYEQQYPQIDNIIDWDNPSPTSGNPNTEYDSPEPDQGKSAKTKNTSLLPTLGTGDPDKLLEGFENRRGPLTLMVDLPFSKKRTSITFPSVPTNSQYQDSVRNADRRATINDCKLHPWDKTALDNLPFMPTELLQNNLISRATLKGQNGNPDVNTDLALPQIAKILGISNIAGLTDRTSPEYRKMKSLVTLWATQRNGPKSFRPQYKMWDQGDLSRDNVIRFTMHSLEGAAGGIEEDDKGGYTKYGIAENEDGDFLPGPGTMREKVTNLSEEQAHQIHIKKYWDKGWGNLPAAKDIKNPRLAYAMYDATLNSRPESYGPVRDIYRRQDISDNQKADLIFAVRGRDMLNNKQAGHGLVNRVKKSIDFMHGKYVE